jgi:hypothetical protein
MGFTLASQQADILSMLSDIFKSKPLGGNRIQQVEKNGD